MGQSKPNGLIKSRKIQSNWLGHKSEVIGYPEINLNNDQALLLRAINMDRNVAGLPSMTIKRFLELNSQSLCL